MKTIDYYYFPQSPYAYFGHQRLAQIAQATGASINVLPIDAAKVFPVSGGLPLAQRPAQRQSYRLEELARWRDFLGLPFNLQPQFFPVAGDPAARMTYAAKAQGGQAAAMALAGAVMSAVWAQQRNIADESILIEIANNVGLAGEDLLAKSKEPAMQAAYDEATALAIARAVFGAPTYMIDGARYWGQDRLDFVERHLRA